MGQCNRHHQSTHGCKTINQRLQNCLLETNYKGTNSKTQAKKLKKPKLLTISQCQKTNLQHKKQTGIFLGHRIQDPQRFRTAPLRILPCSKASLPPSQCCHQGSLSSSSVANSVTTPGPCAPSTPCTRSFVLGDADLPRSGMQPDSHGRITVFHTH